MTTPMMSDVTTHDIRVGARAYYLPEESNPEGHVYYFGYRILILNNSSSSVRLMSRRWEIIDGAGNRRVVEGDGVVGEQPKLDTNRGFKYTSFCTLPTHWGTMEGCYTLQRPGGSTFEIAIGRFWLTTENTS